LPRGVHFPRAPHDRAAQPIPTPWPRPRPYTWRAVRKAVEIALWSAAGISLVAGAGETLFLALLLAATGFGLMRTFIDRRRPY
jgi:hypothetical protein